jgi:hypothetical protein
MRKTARSTRATLDNTGPYQSQGRSRPIPIPGVHVQRIMLISADSPQG